MSLALFCIILAFGLWCFITLFRSSNGVSYYNGPKPTSHQQAVNQQWITEYFERYPDSHLAHDYPYNATLARATKAYRELETRRSTMDSIDYEIELEKITSTLSLHDIK